MRLSVALLLAACLLRGASNTVPPVVPGDSHRGEKIFESEHCIQCHAVNGRGGRMGIDLGRSVSRGYTPSRLASTMWNHAPVMWGAIGAAKIKMPRLSPRDASDLFAFFYSSRFFDRPGEVARGKETFAARQCGGCHGITTSIAEGAPPVSKWDSLDDPVLLVQQMWNHSYPMRQAFARHKLEWQSLTSEQLDDILAYLRSLPETQHLVSRFSNTSDENGRHVFEVKGCVNCHKGELALENRLHNMTLTDIAVDMWNHAPRMMAQPPTLSPVEMRQLLSFLWMRQFVYPGGDVAEGKRVFTERRCGDCHYGGSHGAPQLPGQARPYSEVTIIAALWDHGPRMLNRMKQAGISWPQFGKPQELADLIAYLNSVQ
ncbi:MAG TPA: c-type cytochrome [Bryobacteraceae bacterium]|nr:c-type cytochrome [Bryobacteraceae bacterium]